MLFLSSQGIPKEIMTYFSVPQGSNSGAIISPCVCVCLMQLMLGMYWLDADVLVWVRSQALRGVLPGKIPWYAYVGGQAVFSSTGLGLR